jgi:hypothetical protein
LLAADAGGSDVEIARSVGVGGSTVYRTKRRFVIGNLEAALSEELCPGAGRKLSGKEEALLHPHVGGEFVARMEDVLDLYAEEPWRKVKVTDSATAVDFAVCTQELVDVHFPKTERIRAVLDDRSPTRTAHFIKPSRLPKPGAC